MAGSLEHAVNETIQSLHLVGTEKIGETLSGVLASLPSLAQELGKASPVSTISDHGILVRSQIGSTLRNVFMHLYRNALDHGIETPDRRSGLGKPTAGKIDLEVTLEADRLKLVMHDDGQGLALERLRSKALANGLIRADESLDASEIANLIFAPGFSTAEKVTQVSGRGVGMDAVRGFVEAEGGAIELELNASHVAAHRDHVGFRVVIRLPGKYAVVPQQLVAPALVEA